jgi:hypothetical protein
MTGLTKHIYGYKKQGTSWPADRLWSPQEWLSYLDIHKLYLQSTQYILLYSIFTTCFDPMWSSSGITYLYNHLDIGFYFPYNDQCLHEGNMLMYMYALLSKFVYDSIQLDRILFYKILLY